MKKKNIILHIVEGLIIIVLSILLFKSCNREKEVEIIKVPIEIHDTIRVDSIHIVEHTHTRYIEKHDTIFTFIHNNDTIEVPIELPIEHKTYQDTIRTDTTEIHLNIDFHGYKTELDSIGINYHYIGERAVEVKKRGIGHGIGLSINAGYGIQLDKQPKFSPYIGVGISYTVGYFKIK